MSKLPLQFLKIQYNFRPLIFRKYCIPNGNVLPITTDLPSNKKPDKHNKKQYDSVNKLLTFYQNQKPIPWDKIVPTIRADLKKDNLNIISIIFNSCIDTKLVKVGICYYKYLLKKGIRLNLIETYLFLSLIKSCRLEIEGNKIILLELYNSIKDHLKYHPVLFKEAIEVFSYFDECWNEILELSDNFNDGYKINNAIVTVAFNKSEPDLGWRKLEKSPKECDEQVVTAYINYCLLKAQEGKFEPSLLDHFIEFFSKNSMTIPCSDVFEKLEKLFAFANSEEGLYYWNIQKTSITKNSICSICNSKLKKVSLTIEEYESLKKNFLRDVIINNNINLKTTKFELDNFLNYLKNASSYNVVIDYLNLKYFFQLQIQQLEKLILQFQKKNLKVLLIGKKHVEKSYLFLKMKKNFQYFLTDNLSDDDVFSIYAAIYGGPNTYIFTQDFFRGYADFLKDDNTKKLLRKWQLLHQFRLNKKSQSIVPPLTHATMPQLTKTTDSKRILFYHLPYSSDCNLKISKSVNWLCLIGKHR